MLNTTMDYLQCPTPGCVTRNKSGKLSLVEKQSKKLDAEVREVISGTIQCSGCKKKFPILRGVAVLVPQVSDYLLTHVKGISRWVPDAEIPSDVRREFQEAKREIETEHIEEDLEAERVTSLYVMNHYLQTQGIAESKAWWKGSLPDSSPEIADMIKRYWDHGPFAKIRELWGDRKESLVELGCGVGGLCVHLRSSVTGYLGVDSSFASIALARSLSLGLPNAIEAGEKVLVPGDLLNGAISQNVRDQIAVSKAKQKMNADFIVGDAVHPPLLPGKWDVSAALNMIDMLDDPGILPALQKKIVKKGGLAIQSSPYVWHPHAAKHLKKQTGTSDSAQAVEKIYEKQGFKIQHSARHVPWLFFKHVRQLEIYSVHLFFGRAP
jgi:SAM-dependent methyltransferase